MKLFEKVGVRELAFFIIGAGALVPMAASAAITCSPKPPKTIMYISGKQVCIDTSSTTGSVIVKVSESSLPGYIKPDNGYAIKHYVYLNQGDEVAFTCKNNGGGTGYGQQLYSVTLPEPSVGGPITAYPIVSEKRQVLDVDHLSKGGDASALFEHKLNDVPALAGYLTQLCSVDHNTWVVDQVFAVHYQGLISNDDPSGSIGSKGNSCSFDPSLLEVDTNTGMYKPVAYTCIWAE